MRQGGRPRRPTRPGQREAEPEEVTPSQLRGSLGEFLFVSVLCVGLLGLIAHVSLIVYFKTAGLRPGIRMLGQEIGGLGPVPAKERLADIVDASFRFPILLQLGETTYFLYYRDHFQFDVDQDALIAQARAIGQDKDLWTRAEEHLLADFEPVELPWNPILDREYSRPRVARLIEDKADSRIHAFPREDGLLRVVVSKPEDQVEAILDGLQKSLIEQALPERRVLKIDDLDSSNEEYLVDPNDAENGFGAVLSQVEIDLDPQDAIAAANVARAAALLHGHILNPGETLELEQVIGPFTEENGYQARPEAPAPVAPPTPSWAVPGEEPVPPFWMDGEPDEGEEGAEGAESIDASEVSTSMGIGVERLGAAVLQALLRAGANLTERSTHKHFGPELSYTTMGLDVRLLPEEGGPPGRLAMRNRWDFPLRLILGIAPDRVYVEIRGLEEPKLTVEIRVGVPEKVPYKTELVRDPALPRGVEEVERAGIDGYRVKIFRKLTRPDGVETQEIMIGEGPVDYEPLSSRILLGTGASMPALVPDPDVAAQQERLLKWLDQR